MEENKENDVSVVDEEEHSDTSHESDTDKVETQPTEEESSPEVQVEEPTVTSTKCSLEVQEQSVLQPASKSTKSSVAVQEQSVLQPVSKSSVEVQEQSVLQPPSKKRKKAPTKIAKPNQKKQKMDNAKPPPIPTEPKGVGDVTSIFEKMDEYFELKLKKLEKQMNVSAKKVKNVRYESEPPNDDQEYVYVRKPVYRSHPSRDNIQSRIEKSLLFV